MGEMSMSVCFVKVFQIVSLPVRQVYFAKEPFRQDHFGFQMCFLKILSKIE